MILNAAHIHLMLNHYPIFAVFFATLLLIFGMRMKQPALRFAAYILFMSAGVLVIVAYLSGSLAEDQIEHVAGVLEQAVDSHEDAGKVTLAVVLLSALAAAYAAWAETRAKLMRGVQTAVVVLGIIGFAAAGYAALLGGYIHHPEVRPGYQTGAVKD